MLFIAYPAWFFPPSVFTLTLSEKFKCRLKVTGEVSRVCVCAPCDHWILVVYILTLFQWFSNTWMLCLCAVVPTLPATPDCVTWVCTFSYSAAIIVFPSLWPVVNHIADSSLCSVCQTVFPRAKFKCMHVYILRPICFFFLSLLGWRLIYGYCCGLWCFLVLCNKLYSVTAVYLVKQVSSDMYLCVAFWIYVLVSLLSEFSVHKSH